MGYIFKIFIATCVSVAILTGCAEQNNSALNSSIASSTIRVDAVTNDVGFGETDSTSSFEVNSTSSSDETTFKSVDKKKEKKKKKEVVVYKPSTHFIHKKSCHWVDDTCYTIKNTKGIKCRKCTECNPKMKIEERFVDGLRKLDIEPYYDGPKLNPYNGTVQGPSGKETYYNLDMSGVIAIMRNLGYDEYNYPYWVRDDGCKMLGNYIMCAASLDIRPRGSLVESSLGTCMVCDTGAFVYSNPYQLDIAVTW